jgi:Rhodopirellula transposase DDE domain
MSIPHATLDSLPWLSASPIADLRLAASTMTGPTRRAVEAERTLKYCGGNPLMAEVVLGWGRQTVARGLAERRTGIICLGAQSAFSGRKRWEEPHPQVAQALRQLAEAPAPQAPPFRPSLTSTRLTAKAALEALREQGDGEELWPSPSTMAEVLNRLGFRLRKVVKAKPHKKLKEPDAICDKIKKSCPSPGIPRRQTLEYRLESDRDNRRVFPWGAHARRQPSQRSRYGVPGELWAWWACGGRERCVPPHLWQLVENK